MKSWPFGLRAIAARIAAVQRRVVGAGAQHAAEIGGIVLAEAHVQRAGAGQPHPVAAFAEIMRHRRDEADAACRSRRRRNSGPGRRWGSRSRPASSAGAGAARTSDSGRYWSVRWAPISPIGIVSIRQRSKPCSPHQASMASNSSSFTPRSATVLIFTVKPGGAGGEDAVQHRSEPAPAGDARRTSPASSVSRLTFTRRTPAAYRASAWRASWVPLVVRVSSSQPARRPSRAPSARNR